MLLIVAHHYVVSFRLAEANSPIYSQLMSEHLIFIDIWRLGKIGINCFVLIFVTPASGMENR